jgi:GABA(A) receptor-associated protein
MAVKKNRDEAEKLMRKYPDRIPIIVSKNPNSTTTPEIDKNRFLCPCDLTLGQFLYVIRKRLQLSPEKGLFLFVDKEVLGTGTLVAQAYENYQCKEDGFLYMVYSCENVFG